jgi:hypothetical protein
MPALRELQSQFLASLFDENDASVSALVREDGIDVVERLHVYRINLREGFLDALRIGFPVIEKLVGPDYFRQLAFELQQAHPSRSGNLHHIGEPFAPFLRERFKGTQYECFGDVAALEWAQQEAQIAPEAEAIGVEAFHDIAPEHYEGLTFEFHPACRFVPSAFPILHIWRANQAETSSDERIDLRAGGENVLVLRTPECVELHALPHAQFTLFETLNRRHPLGAALDAAQTVDPDFDLGAALRQLLGLRILTAVRRPLSATL